MIFLSTVMDEEETNTNNSVEHYDDHGRGLEAAILLCLHVHVDITITEASSLLSFYNDQCPVVNSTGVL